MGSLGRWGCIRGNVVVVVDDVDVDVDAGAKALVMLVGLDGRREVAGGGVGSG